MYQLHNLRIFGSEINTNTGKKYRFYKYFMRIEHNISLNNYMQNISYNCKFILNDVSK